MNNAAAPLGTGSSSPGQIQDITDAALSYLTATQQRIIREHSRSGVNDIQDIVDKARIAAEEKKRLCEHNRWRYRFRGSEIELRHKAGNVVDWLERFKAVGDVAVNASPMFAGLPWAGVRLVLEVRSYSLSPVGAITRY